MRCPRACVLLLSCALVTPTLAQPPTTPDAPTSTAITVYNVNMALVKDTRRLELTEGLNQVRLSDVAASIDPTSVHFRSLTAPDSCVIREQNYQYDLVSRSKLLDKYLGREITVRQRQDGGGFSATTGVLMSAQEQPARGNMGSGATPPGAAQAGLVLSTPNGLLIVSPDSIELPELPEGLIVRPTLDWLIECTQPGGHDVEVSYITDNVRWNCDYIATVNADDTRTDLTGWVTLHNRSGATYRDAHLKLIAGDVRRIEPQVAARTRGGAPGGMGMPGAAPQFEEQAFFEYHMYGMARPTTIRDNETKQVELLTTHDVPVTKLYYFNGRHRTDRGMDQPWGPLGKSKVQVKIQFTNSEADHLGMPLPKGKVRVYKSDPDGSRQFIGEDELDHTPRDEKVRLYIGDAFDVVGEWKQTDRRNLGPGVWEESVEVLLRNHKDQDVEVICEERGFSDWEIVKESMPSKKTSAHSFEYVVPVPKDTEAKITYTIRYSAWL